MSERYNGWSNYATWRVNLELCDDIVSSLIGEQTFTDVGYLATYLQETCEEYVRGEDDQEQRLATQYATAFLDDVNWYEIAEHAADDLVRSDDDDSESDDV